MEGSDERVYAVRGMTCEHCRAAVAAEVGALPGAPDVQVDLAAGTITISGQDVENGAVAAAVREAGYEVAPCGQPRAGTATSALSSGPSQTTRPRPPWASSTP